MDAAAKEGEAIVKGEEALFAQQVVQASAQKPVAVLFYNPQAEPERAFVEGLKQAIKSASEPCQLVLFETGSAPQLAEQLQIGQAPALFLFRKSRPECGFFGPLPQAQLTPFLSRFAGNTNAPSLEAANEALEAGDAALAASLYAALLEAAPNDPQALAGLAETYLQQGDAARAKALLAGHIEEAETHPALAKIKARLELADKAPQQDEEASLRQKIEANPAEHQPRFDLALCLNAKGEKAQAAQTLLESIRLSPQWNEGAARKQLLEFFAAWGEEDDATLDARRKLTNLLFR